ncbi:MAG: hypothetical protein MHM6MM_003941 [Cercozoa sp. M6MM]
MKLEGKTVVVTGGASGLGEATSRALLASKANVLVIDLDADKGEALQAEFPDQVLYVKADVCSETEVQQAINDAVTKFGALHGVVNCAGVAWPCRVLNRRNKVHSLQHFDKVVRINLLGSFNVLRLAARAMADNTCESEDGERGVIVNVASVAAFDGQIGQAAYSASKGGVVGMTLPLARDLARVAIRVVSIAPGIMGTPLLKGLPQPAQDSLSQQVPYPARLGEPNEFAQLVLHIFRNSYLNGETIRLDGALRMAAM